MHSNIFVRAPNILHFSRLVKSRLNVALNDSMGEFVLAKPGRLQKTCHLLKTPSGRLFRLNRRRLRKRILVLPGTKSAPTPMPPSPAPPEVSPEKAKPHKRS